MLLAAHQAGVGMSRTGLGVCHAIGHSLGGRFDVAHGVALTMVLPGVLRFNLPACRERLAAMAFALGAGDTARGAAWNATAAIDAVTALADRVGMTHRLPDFGITAADFGAIASDALDDEVLANTPRPPTEADIRAMLASALHGARGAYRRIGGTCHGTEHPPRHPTHRRGIRGTYRGTERTRRR